MPVLEMPVSTAGRQKVTTLMREIEALTDEYVAETLDFVQFLRAKQTNRPSKTKSMFGAFPGINTNVEREEDRI